MGIFNKKDYTNLRYTNETFPLHYQIQQKIELMINGTVINDSTTDIIWRIDSWKENSEGYIVSIVTEKYENNTCLEHVADFLKFFSKFNEPAFNLLIQTNKKGDPIKILNQTDIYEKWLSFRNGELSELTNGKIYKELSIAGDKDFSDVLYSMIKKINYFIFFFTPVYGQKKGFNPKYNNINMESILFPDNKVEVIVGENISDSSDSGMRIEHIGLGCIDDQGKIERIFKDEYKIEASFSYDYCYNANYLYNIDGKMIRCNAEIQEKASEKMISKQTSLITIME